MRKSTHPWINDKVLQLVREKMAAEGTAKIEECRKRCSACIMEEYGKYIIKEKRSLQDMPKGAKAWWSRSRRLIQKKGVVSSIPALKNTENQWVLDAKEKANLFGDTFSKKCFLNPAEDNEYTKLQSNQDNIQTRIRQLQEKDAEQVMAALREDSGTGPDTLPARILKKCRCVPTRQL